jgi:hypothetical protein
MPEVENRCLHCGKQTTNPKFCDRSCAAAHNNATTPKRGPEGACESCQKPVSKRRKLCDACRAEREEHQRREQAGILTIRNLRGEPLDVKAFRASTSSCVTFSIFRWGGTSKFDGQATCGELVDLLLGILASEPEYIQSTDAGRYAAMLLDFRAFEFEDWQGSTKQRRPVATTPLIKSDWAIREWIESHLRQDEEPLMATFAVDAAAFMKAHAFGQYVSRASAEDDAPSWRIEPVFARELLERQNGGSGWSCLQDKRLKRDITRQVGGLWVLAKVPEKSSITAPYRDGAILLKPGEWFLYQVERCHVSESFFDFPTLRVETSDPAPYDLGGRACFTGGIAMQESGEVLRPIMSTDALGSYGFVRRMADKPTVRIPLRWITAIVEIDERGWRNKPLPTWGILR